MIIHQLADVAEYHLGDGLWKPYLHPVRTPRGRVVTWDSPPDHPHHRGVTFSFTDADGTDYWGEDVVAAETRGRIQHDSFRGWKDSLSGTLVWTDRRGRPAFHERRAIRVERLPQGTRIVWVTEIEACEGPVTRTTVRPYDTFCIRCPAWKSAQVINALGHRGREAVMGKPAEWVALTGEDELGPIGVMLQGDPANPRHPPTWWVAAGDSMVFGGAGFFFHEPMRFEPGRSMRLRYSLLAFDGAVPV